MARTYKDDLKYRGRKSRRSERGVNRGRRWLDEGNGRRNIEFRIPRGLELRDFRSVNSERFQY